LLTLFDMSRWKNMISNRYHADANEWKGDYPWIEFRNDPNWDMEMKRKESEWEQDPGSEKVKSRIIPFFPVKRQSQLLMLQGVLMSRQIGWGVVGWGGGASGDRTSVDIARGRHAAKGHVEAPLVAECVRNSA
jgi:hypothetical protein